MNRINIKVTALSVVCALTVGWPQIGQCASAQAGTGAQVESDAAATEADYRSLSQAEYEDLLQEAERARAQAEAARREAEKAAQQARETARRHTEQARREAEAERQEAMAAAQRDRERARQENAQEKEMAEAQRREFERERQRLEEDRERARALRQEEMERIREELSRAHRELREATREIARAHRDVGRGAGTAHVVTEINLGDRAVIGVILGPETAQGVKVIGVSPGGPAEQAGLQSGDVITAIRGESLARQEESGGRAALYRVMNEAEAGETLAMVVDRDGATWNFDVTAERREPSSWQTLVRIPQPPDAPDAPAEPGVAPTAPPVLVERIERIEVPAIDEESLNERVHEITQRLNARNFTVVVPDGQNFEFDGDFEFPESFDLEFREYSDLAEQALEEADMWFGLPQSQGLELARLNEGLGAYFKTDRGVLVLEASEDNAYALRSGDVVLEVNENPVASPADLMRALRAIEPGQEVRLAIMRDRKDRSIAVTMPENRLGYSWSSKIDPED